MAWTPEQYEENLAPYALIPSRRIIELGKEFRKSGTPVLDCRTEYHRDRDRILWSKAFKRLQHKTQVFPHYVEDHYKRRLTHSLEVAQISTTVARALGLNEIATEAIALGHDLGHTPFGHAGEKALQEILRAKTKKVSKGKCSGKKKSVIYPIPIFHFDHCMHGIEVVSRIEKEYDHETHTGGLNLTFDVRDGILKHMYDSDGKCHAEEKRIKIPEVVKQFSKYNKYKNNKGSLEAQCVYFADKVCYLFGDIEDGIRSDILQCEKLNSDDLWDLVRKEYKNLRPGSEEPKLEKRKDFAQFRNTALTVLILNCIGSAKEKIEAEDFKDIKQVLKTNKRMVFVSDELHILWGGFYDKWMKKCLFEDSKVKMCSFKAKEIVRGLFKAYLETPELMDKKYVEHCEKAYKGMFKDSEKELLSLVIVTNYIAGMTDVFATNQHARLYMSSERVSF